MGGHLQARVSYTTRETDADVSAHTTTSVFSLPSTGHATAPDDQIMADTSPNAREKILTPVDTTKLKTYLDGYDDDRARFLVEGFETGFQIPFQACLIKQDTPRNLTSALEHPHVSF